MFAVHYIIQTLCQQGSSKVVTKNKREGAL